MPGVRVQPVQDAVAALLGGEDLGEEGGVGRGGGEDASAIGGDVDFEEDEGFDLRVGDKGLKGGEEGHLGGVVEEEGQGVGTEGGCEGCEAGERGRVEGEGVEDVCGAALLLVGEEERGDVFGFEEGGDDYIGGGRYVGADLEFGELCCLLLGTRGGREHMSVCPDETV